MRLFSTEQVSKYHPDKYADQISDAILDACLARDKNCRVACECMVKGKTIYLCGEITTTANIDYAKVAKRVAAKLGYEVETVVQQISIQSPEIAGGVGKGNDLKAGDQGIMFGYACNDTESLLPYGFDMANNIIRIIEQDVSKPDSRLKGDAKCQVTVDLSVPCTDEGHICSVLVSVCHKENIIDNIQLRGYIARLLDENGYDADSFKLKVNPAGRWTIGGPAADCGLTGRKIVCDQYGGYCGVGGGAFSGKDPTKVDRSAAYMARKIACEVLKQHALTWCEVQLAYAIGEKHPMSVSVHSSLPTRDAIYSDEVLMNYDLTPSGIIKTLDLLNINYEKLSEGCHYRRIGTEVR